MPIAEFGKIHRGTIKFSFKIFVKVMLSWKKGLDLMSPYESEVDFSKLVFALIISR